MLSIRLRSSSSTKGIQQNRMHFPNSIRPTECPSYSPNLSPLDWIWSIILEIRAHKTHHKNIFKWDHIFYSTFNFVLKPRQTILKRVKDITIECFCHYYEMYHIISCSTIWPKYVSSNYFATSCNCNMYCIVLYYFCHYRADIHCDKKCNDKECAIARYVVRT
jgi:hypothetical protein